MTVFDLVLASLATYRVTRLVTADKITERLREAVTARSDFFGYLVTCDWCLSIWIAPWVAGAVLFVDHDVITLALVALSLSAITGVMSMIEKRLDTD